MIRRAFAVKTVETVKQTSSHLCYDPYSTYL